MQRRVSEVGTNILGMDDRAPFAALLHEAMTRRSLTLQDVAGRVQRASGHRSRVSRQLVSRWRSGAVTPSPVHVRWLCQALDLDLTVFARAASEQRPSPATSDVVSPLQLLPPNSADLDYVQVLRDATQQIVRLDNLLGADDVAAVCRRLLQSVQRQLRDGRYKPSAETPLRSAAAELAELTGWLLFDSLHLSEARQASAEAAVMARRAGDEGIEVLALTNLALQGQFEGDSEASMQAVKTLQLLAETHSPRVRAVVWMREGRVHSQLGNRDEMVRAFDNARHLFLDGPEGAPMWGWWIDEAELDFHNGMAHAELAEVGPAVELINGALGSIAPNRVRDQAMYQVQLLGVLAHAHAWHDASDVVEDLSASLTEVASKRTSRLLARSIDTLIQSAAPTDLVDGARSLVTEML